MSYIIRDGNNYIHTGKNGGHSITNDINKATKYQKIKTANNILNSLGGKIFKDYNFDIEYVTDDNKVADDLVEPVELDFDIVDKVKEIASVAKQVEERKGYLLNKISVIDMSIVDIEHAAEFYELNASQGYKLYKMLHDARVERREVKDELQKLNMFLDTKISSGYLNQLANNIVGLKNRQYTPRVIKELFGV